MKDASIKKVLVIGSGPIQIGQAAEFDYSGSQACLALREEGVRTLLVNNNPATIQTDIDVADVVYFEPITLESLARIIEKERPDGLLSGMGGQTGLNMTVKLAEAGVLDKYDVRILGTPLQAIKNGEGRKEFAELMKRIGEPVCKSKSVHSLHEAQEALIDIGLPAIIRPGFTLGGTGGGVAFTQQDFDRVVQRALSRSMNGEALIEEYVGGWKEIEFEVMRDKADNCIIVCSMENFDPMGIHTGESIVVAPTQTLNDTEYQMLRSASIKIIRALGVEGGCNVQYALNPNSTEYRVIEVNPRVSRSSALASKATGYPIARVAAKIAIGMTLDEISNEVTKSTPASFEPSIDYIVTKIPRWPFDKFKGIPRYIGTEMKSTGEVMSIGRTFEESLQKAIRSLDIKRQGLCADGRRECTDKNEIEENLKKPTDMRLFYIYDALKNDFSVDQIFELTKIDRFFLEKIKNIVCIEAEIKKKGLTKELVLKAKRAGFSDTQLGFLTGEKDALKIRAKRKSMGIEPCFKIVDTCAAEFEAKTPYFYSCYEHENETIASDRKKVIILGAGPIRIGQGVEFDYCTVHAVTELRRLGYEAIIINNNPETVSTDFDTSDKLYFEPLTLEDVLNIIDKEGKNLEGVMVQFGGQTAINLVSELDRAGVKILGTQPEAIDMAEDRERFGRLLAKLNIPAPKWGSGFSYEEAKAVANNIGYPVLVRPSYVLGGRAMEIIYNDAELEKYMREAAEVSPDKPILIDKFLDDALEVDVDAVCDGEDVYIGGIMEHIEEAGIHSGDSACVIPPQTLSKKTIETLKDYTKKMALGLNTLGLINIQYAIKDGAVYVLEANPRSSRTIPFVSKATGVPLAKLAVRVIMGDKLRDIIKDFDHAEKIKHVAVKEVVLPFDKLRIDPILGPEMRSTGESLGIDDDFGRAFYKAELGADLQLPKSGRIFFSVSGDKEKERIAEYAKELESMGFKILATKGTCEVFRRKGIDAEYVKKVSEGSPNVVDMIEGRRISLVINIPKKGIQTREDERLIRSKILDYDIPYITTLSAARAAVSAIKSVLAGNISTKSWGEYFQL